jgi:hypothetical protein
MARIKAAVDAKKTNHQSPLYFFTCSIDIKFVQK